MPRVPVPSFSDVRTEAPLPGPMQDPGIANPNTFGAGYGEAIQNSADLAGIIYWRAKHAADESAVTAAAAKGQNALNDLVLNPDPNGAGYYRLQGADAMAARQPTLDAVDKQLAQIAAPLTPDQREMWQHVQTQIRDSAVHHIDSHEATQIHHVDVANTKGAADALSRSLQMPGIIADPQQVQDTLDKLDGVLTAGAKRQLGQSASPDAIRSVVSPVMQTAALDGMNAALASQDPGVAKAAYEKLSPYLGVHERLFAGAVQRMANTKDIGTQAGTILGTGMTKVAMPDGGETVRVDAGKVLEGIGNLSPDNPLRDQVAAEAEKRQAKYGEAWKASVDRVAAGALTAGTDPATAKFDISKVSPAALEWLRQNAPKELIALGKEDARAQRVDTRVDRAASAENYSDALTALYDPAQKQDLMNLSMDGFQTSLLDEQKYPGGFTAQDRVKLTKQFALMQKQGFDEKVGATVKEELKKAFPHDTDEQDQRFGELLDRASTFVRQYGSAGSPNEGKLPGTKEIRDYVVNQLAQEPGTGIFGSDFGAKRRIDLPRQVAPIPTAAATPVAPTPPPLPAGRVAVKNAQGQRFTLPEKQVDAFLSSPGGKGFSRE
jgi:hypothetical protein